MDIQSELSTLWIVVMLNMIFADIFSIIVELKDGGLLDIPGDAQLIMAIAAVITNIPLTMIYFSRSLPYKINRIANIVAGMFTIVYVIGGGVIVAHYIIIGLIEVAILCVIVGKAWRWKAPMPEPSGQMLNI